MAWKSSLALLAGGFICLTNSRIWAQSAPPDSQPLVERALAAGEVFRKQLRTGEYDAAVQVKEFDNEGAIRGTAKARMVVRPGATPSVVYLTRERQGKIRLPDDKPDSQHDDDDDTTVPEFAAKHQVAQRFRFTVEGPEVVAGQSAYRVAFSPKPDQPEKNGTDRFLDAVAGHAWVTEDKSRLVKFEMELQHPHELFWFLAVLREFSFRFEVLEPGEILGRARILVRFHLSTPVWSLRQEHEMLLDHFRPRPTTGKADAQ